MAHVIYPCKFMNHLLFLFSFIATLVTFISCSEVVEDQKDLYKQVLADLNLTLHLLESLPVARVNKLRNACHELKQALKAFEATLKSDQVIDYFCGSSEKIEGENPGYRMLRIYRRDTRNPFVEKMNKSRMIRPKEVTFPQGVSIEYLGQWSDLLDRDLVHFSPSKLGELKDLEEVVISAAVEKVKKMLIEKFVEQGGELVDGKIIFSKYNIESKAWIYGIDRKTYKEVFVNFDAIKFTKK